jgi:hypothetical protein
MLAEADIDTERTTTLAPVCETYKAFSAEPVDEAGDDPDADMVNKRRTHRADLRASVCQSYVTVWSCHVFVTSTTQKRPLRRLRSTLGFPSGVEETFLERCEFLALGGLN